MSDNDDLHKNIVQSDPILRTLVDRMTESITKSFENSIDKQVDELFGSMTTMVPEQNKNLSIEELMKTAQMLETPAQAWARDREACIKEDREKGRGTLVLNPELDGAIAMRGNITEKDGVEYRVLVDGALRGMRDKSGGIQGGYWIDPLPPLAPLPLMVEPEPGNRWDEISIRARMLSYPPLPMQPIQGVGVDVVDLGPVPVDMVAAELPKAAVREQRRILGICWKAHGRGISLKEYARGSKMGKAWLERKKR